MARKYACYDDAIKKIIRVGEANKLSLAEIINHTDFGKKKEHESFSEFNKFIRREIRCLIKEIGKIEHSNKDKLVEQVSGKGKENYYYWYSSEHKVEAITGEYDLSEERYFARALVFDFVEQHFRELFPPEVMENLKKDLNDIRNEGSLLSGLDNKIQLMPSGIDVWPVHGIEERNPEDWNIAYQALKDEFVIKANYDSLHKPEIECVHLSPQNVQYANHKVVLQCYVHETGKVKTYEVSRLVNVEKAKEYKFHKVNFADFEREYDFEAIANVGVKTYFDSVKFGSQLTSEPGEKGTWVIKCKISVPEHFSSHKAGPDPFAIANFLSNFSDAIEVIKPDFLRDEMKTRADNLSKIYSPGFDSLPIIAKTPYDGNKEKSN